MKGKIVFVKKWIVKYFHINMANCLRAKPGWIPVKPNIFATEIKTLNTLINFTGKLSLKKIELFLLLPDIFSFIIQGV